MPPFFNFLLSLIKSNERGFQKYAQCRNNAPFLLIYVQVDCSVSTIRRRQWRWTQMLPTSRKTLPIWRTQGRAIGLCLGSSEFTTSVLGPHNFQWRKNLQKWREWTNDAVASTKQKVIYLPTPTRIKVTTYEWIENDSKAAIPKFWTPEG